MRDLLLFNMLTVLAIVHFLLKTKGTYLEQATLAYSIMWVMSLLILLWLRVYHGERGDLVDYDENLKRDHLPLVFGSVAAIALVSSLIVSGLARSALYVPRPSLALGTEPLSTAGFMDDILYNFVLVAPAEENIKLMAALTLYRKTKRAWVSVGMPVGVWAALHAYQAYLGSLMPVLVFSAFLSGLILFAVVKYTSSLQNAIITHGLFNTLVVLTSLVSR